MSLSPDLEPRAVLAAFEAIGSIPHGSGNTKALSDYILNYALERGCEARQDEANNVIIVKPASTGYEDAPTVILQGHIDMVCEKAPGVDFDFRRDPILMTEEDGWIHARGTTLGADDGIAAAICMAILDDPSLPHPRLEMILTTDEEVGLDGADALDMSDIRGRRLINIDSEEEGTITVSCAGGARVECSLPYARVSAEGIPVTISVSGLLGGHSGMEIDKGRASANFLLGRILLNLSRSFSLRLISAEGGTNDNAIARSASATFLANPAQTQDLMRAARSFGDSLSKEYRTADPGLTLTVESGNIESALVLPADTSRKVFEMIALAPQGIQEMSMDISGLVQTSLNMGILRTDEDSVKLIFAVRSSVATQKEMLIERLQVLMERLGGCARAYSAYPAWEFRKDSDLRNLLMETYKDLTGKDAVIFATHGGLECGLFCGKIPDLDCVSIGPDIMGAHTPQEKVSVESVRRTWEFVLEVLRRSR